MNSTVTIVTPLFKQSQYLGECVDSVLAQTHKEWSMVIVEDGGTEEDYEEAEKQAKKSKRISVIHHSKNLGLSAARNTGILVSKTPHILPLDADDKLHPRCLEKLLEAIEDGFGDFIYCDYNLFGERSGRVDALEYCYEFLLGAGNYIAATTLFRRKDWLMAGKYDETMKRGYEDWNLWLKMGKLGLEGYRVAEALFYYRQKENSMVKETIKNHQEIKEEAIRKAGL